MHRTAGPAGGERTWFVNTQQHRKQRGDATANGYASAHKGEWYL